uniref:I/LWEQ domain-containing protein n=1 Tax=Glossina pallidipes TaxID=7398 RepID=A0A1A9Z0V8_GLOPL
MDKDYNNLVVSIMKALNPSEAPLKMKHARSIIIATYRTKELKSFWAIITRQPLMAHRFTAWKFCHMLHKVTREGHPISLKQSLVHKTLILDVGKLWGHLQDGVGACIESYTKLLVNKLQFHEKNVIFPGSLLLEFSEIEKFAENDENVYFQLCVEIFDYLDHIIDVQTKIFASVNMFRMSSMTRQGQCRLAPLISLIQESSSLYDISVRLMFKLHNSLLRDVLIGHRERFNDLFSKMKHFYNDVKPLQYFADVIQVPSLPENAPDFLHQIDLGIYVAPAVQVELDQEEFVENIADNLRPAENSKLCEKDTTVRRLQEELRQKDEQLKNEAKLVYQISDLSFKNQSLETELAAAKAKFIVAINKIENLELRLKDASNVQSDAREWEEKAKSIEEKFEKIKLLYASLREEHINLLRTEGTREKNITRLKFRIKEIEEELTIKANEHQQQLANKNLEITELKSDITQMQETFKQLKAEHDTQLVKYQELLKENEISRKRNETKVSLEQLDHLTIPRENAKRDDTLTDMNLTVKAAFAENSELSKSVRNLSEKVTSPNCQLVKANNEVNQLRRKNVLVETISSVMKETFKIWTEYADKNWQNIGTIEDMLQQINVEYSQSYKSPREIYLIISTYLALIQSVTSPNGCLTYVANNTPEATIAREMMVNLKAVNIIREPTHPFLSNRRYARTRRDVIASVPSVTLKVKRELMFSLVNASSEVHHMDQTLQMELKVTDEVIEKATNKIMEICSDSKTSNNSIKLEKHNIILDSCTFLMKAIKILIKKSRLLQEEIVAQGKAHFPVKEFYKRNSQWAEGLISASKDIGKGANYLVEAANRLLNRESCNNFEIIVAAQEIAASTAQLVIASNVKADKFSQTLAELTKAARNVSQATESVVAVVKDANIQQENLNELELLRLTPSQMKTREMEIHVKVLELEQALQTERYKLMSFRKACYKNARED